MHKSTKIFSGIALAFALSACASTGARTGLSENLSIAPAIDVPYSEVSKNIPENIGLNVRWGGQIISSKRVGEVTELTVFASKLSKDSRPIPGADEDFEGGRFIVAVPEYEETLLSRYITVYGQVSGERTLVNGPKTKVIPVVTAVETKEWSPQIITDKRGPAYYSLAYRTGHFNSFNRFGHRGFGHFGKNYYGSRFNSFNRFGHRGSFLRRGRH